MIQVNELRIGNLVLIEKDGKWEEEVITGISLASDKNKIEGFSDPFIRYNSGSTVLRFGDDEELGDYLVMPIQLTGERLLTFGFEMKEYEMSGCTVFELPHSDWRIGQSLRDEFCFSLWHKQVSPPTWALARFNYVHKLQNLIHAFTGQELKYNQS